MVKVNMSLMERARKKTKSDVVFMIVTAVIIVFLIAVMALNVVFFKVKIRGESMEPTMYTGEVLVANRYKKPTYGSIVIISGENPRGDWIIKRVIAMEGDTVEIRVDGYVYVKYAGTKEFVKIEEPYVKRQGLTAFRDWQTRTLGKNEIFYLGDNRERSHDSRSEEYSTCDISQIVGVVEDWSFSNSLRYLI